jgi:lysophospholipase L1-like esterase
MTRSIHRLNAWKLKLLKIPFHRRFTQAVMPDNTLRVNRGVVGNTSTQMLAGFQTDVVDLRPEVVHILFGTNDAASAGWVFPCGGDNPRVIPNPAATSSTWLRWRKLRGIKVVIGMVPHYGTGRAFSSRLD